MSQKIDKEIKDLFKQTKNYKFNLVLLHNLKNNKVDANRALINAISNINNDFDIMALILILRYGGNPNLYIRFDKNNNKSIHLIGFAYINKDKINYFDNVITILLFSGSLPYKKIFNNVDSKSVLEWVNENFEDNIINNELYKKSLYDEDFNSYSILLNNYHFQKSKFSKDDNILAIKSFSKCIDKIPFNDKIKNIDYSVFISSLNSINKYAFNHYLKLGFKPSYLLIINLILEINNNIDTKNIIVYKELIEILKYCIEHGVQLDSYQWNLLKIKDDERKILLKLYEKPLWEKLIVKDSDIVSEKLKNIAISLNLSYISNNDINNELTKLQKLNKDDLKKSFIRLQQNRLNAVNLGQDIDDINNILFNKSVFKDNPLDYNNYFVVFYKDNNDLFWCFYYDKFEEILNNKYNPYNNTLLPEETLLEIKFKLEYLNTLDVNNIIKLYSEAVDNIHNNDTINNDESIKEVNNFFELINTNNIYTNNVNFDSKKDLQRRLKLINIDIDFENFNIEFCVIIVARIINKFYELGIDFNNFFN